jgi:hypothetical protein
MGDDTRIRAMELRLQADRIEAWAAVVGEVADDDPAAVLQAPASVEELRMLALADDRERRRLRVAESKVAYVEHLRHPDCTCGQPSPGSFWVMCPLAREEGFR